MNKLSEWKRELLQEEWGGAARMEGEKDMEQ